MTSYETLFLARTQITNDELTQIEKQLETLCKKAQGSLSSFDKWGKYRLAFPVQKEDYGVYVLARFEAPADKMGALDKDIQMYFKIKCNDVVMRHVTVKLEGETTAEYIKPDPIESKASGNFDSFIKENKMEGLLGTKVEAAKDPENPEEAPQPEESEQAPAEQPAQEPVEENGEQPAQEEVSDDEKETETAES